MVVEGVRSIPDTEGKMQSFKVTGMTCAHCVRAVTDAVRGVDAAADVKVDLAEGRVTVSGGTATAAQVASAIAAEGYAAEPVAA